MRRPRASRASDRLSGFRRVAPTRVNVPSSRSAGRSRCSIVRFVSRLSSAHQSSWYLVKWCVPLELGVDHIVQVSDSQAGWRELGPFESVSCAHASAVVDVGLYAVAA